MRWNLASLRRSTEASQAADFYPSSFLRFWRAWWCHRWMSYLRLFVVRGALACGILLDDSEENFINFKNFKNFLKLTWNHTCKCTIRPYGKRKKGWEEPPISQKSNFDLFYSWEILRPFRHILHGRKMSQSRSVRERKLWNLIKIGTGTREVPEAQRCIFSNWISSCNHVGFLLLLKFIPWLASAMHSRDRSINLWVFNAFASALFHLPNWIWWLLICELYEAAQHWQVDIADFFIENFGN